MKIGILVNEGPDQHQASDSAYHFCKAAIDSGHQIDRVFFNHDGVYNANRHGAHPDSRPHAAARWSELAERHDVDLVVCAASGLRRGVGEDVLAKGFRIGGAGQLIECAIRADRLVVFGD